MMVESLPCLTRATANELNRAMEADKPLNGSTRFLESGVLADDPVATDAWNNHSLWPGC